MSKPTNIYKPFSRELLENFVWQLQTSSVEYERHFLLGFEAGSVIRLAYSFECPTKRAAEKLRAYMREQAGDKITISARGRGCVLRGQTGELAFDLPTILRWVGYMCDAGNGCGCRFDGWKPKRTGPAASGEGEGQTVEGEPQSTGPDYPHLVVAKILDAIDPFERGEKYDDPLDEVLQERSLGEVTGGGSQLSSDFEVAYVDLEIHLADLDGALELTRQTLRKLGAPKGSELRFARECVVPICD